ncbi:RNA polymerase sigma factor, sigma-70 family [Lentzea xinjiangensis]|uniref:RNA polymerase sigma factor, sigma-70 family n=1 Tax=Lentzea xinjiangensis TaxID=402600 RepID=A0A1H9L135_9PSEU|nr:sigma-70 family RNA polymerase sigma factor [Lentzea xinjiangensis]SER04847.1 RNA polymerase sigma factor, sigma-70 family [Lentzea xinjiangensis]
MEIPAALAAAARGDQAAWDGLVKQFSGLLWSIARAYRLNDADAADAVQCTWVKLVEHLDRIAEPERLAGWLATTARHECLQLIRRAGRLPEPSEEIADSPDPAPAVDHALIVGERNAALWRVFEELPDRCRRLLRVLMASPPPAYADVALALDMPVGSIGPIRQRCLNRLKALVTGNELLEGRS